MATQDLTANVDGIGYKTETLTNTVTFAGESAGEVVQLFDVGNGVKVVDAYVATAALGASVTLILGDGTDPDGFVTATTANTAGVYRLNGAYRAKVYSANDTIDLTTAGGAATGAVTVVLTVVRTY